MAVPLKFEQAVSNRIDIVLPSADIQDWPHEVEASPAADGQAAAVPVGSTTTAVP
jgi:hypothetical protein